MKLDVNNLEAKKAGSIDLSDDVFGIAPDAIRKDILHRMVRWQLAKRRRGTHDTLARGEVNRTKSKFGRQKGGGRARHGARTPGIFVGGAKAHAPKPRAYEHDLPKKVRQMALKHALSAKAGAEELIILDDARMDAPKTKTVATAFAALNATNALVIGGAELDANFAKAARNLPDVDVLPIQGLNVYDVLRRRKLVLTREAVDALHARFSSEGEAA